MDSDSENQASTQLEKELEAHIRDSFDFSEARPILKHLNADSSWLLSLPYPGGPTPPPGRCRFNIVIDVWLRGPQIDLFSWFSLQEHASPSSVQTFAQLNDLLEKAESAVTGQTIRNGDGDNYKYIDAVCCSHEFTDHCHEATLRELPSRIPVFAPKKAAGLIRSWKHFENVFEIPLHNSPVTSQKAHLPHWITLRRVHTNYDGPIYFHSALLINFSLYGSEPPETIIYTPHGIVADSLTSSISSGESIKILALLHGLHDVSLAGNRLNLGIDNAVKLVRTLDVKYWIPTHDEVKHAHGIVSSFLKRIEHTLPVAPGSHPITDLEDTQPKISADSFLLLGNGETCVLR